MALLKASEVDLVPGCYVFVRYQGDPHSHERLLVRQANGGRPDAPEWVVLTPDDDLYLEPLAGDGRRGPITFHRMKGRIAHHGIPHPRYRFTQPLTEAEFKETYKAAGEILVAERRGEILHDQFADPTGARQELGHIVDVPVPSGRRRAMKKGPPGGAIVSAGGDAAGGAIVDAAAAEDEGHAVVAADAGADAEADVPQHPAPLPPPDGAVAEERVHKRKRSCSGSWCCRSASTGAQA